MRHPSWSIGVVALAIVGLVAVGGPTVSGDSVDAVSALLALAASLAAVVGMAGRHGSPRRIEAPVGSATQAVRVAGQRVF